MNIKKHDQIKICQKYVRHIKVFWNNKNKIQEVFQKICVADPFSTINQPIDKLKKLYFPGYNRFFTSEAFFISIAEFVDACDIPC